MKNTLKLSNYLFGWLFHKSERFVIGFSLAMAIILLLFTGGFSQNRVYEHIAIEFRTFDMVIDYSGVGLVFFLGLLTLFAVIFIQINGFYTNGKGMYSILTLPMKRHEVFFAFFFSATAAVFLYFAVWLIVMAALYFPVTSMYEKEASQAVLRISENVTLKDLDTSITNGFFLAFQRSTFLSACFPVSWIQALTLTGGMFLSITAIVFGGLYNEYISARVGLLIVVLAGFFVAFYRAWVFFQRQLFYTVENVLPGSLYFCAAAVVLGVVLIIVAVRKLKGRKDI